MQVGKWGNSLAIRLPAALAEKLGLKEGDEVELRPAADGALEVARDTEYEARRQEALKQIEALRYAFPDDYRFNRDEANER